MAGVFPKVCVLFNHRPALSRLRMHASDSSFAQRSNSAGIAIQRDARPCFTLDRTRDDPGQFLVSRASAPANDDATLQTSSLAGCCNRCCNLYVLDCTQPAVCTIRITGSTQARPVTVNLVALLNHKAVEIHFVKFCFGSWLVRNNLSLAFWWGIERL